MSTAEKSERPEQNQDLRCQWRRRLQRMYGADQQRLQISDLHF